MEPKKNPDIAVGRNSSLYFAVGLNIMLLTTWMLLEHKTYEKADRSYDIVQVSQELEEDISITEVINIPPPPPPAPAAPEIIKVVEDIEEIQETVLESTETDQDERIEEREIVEVNDVEVEEVDEDVEVPFAVVERVPVFPGCSGSNAALMACFKSEMTKHVQKHFKYPETAIENNMQGKVFVMFTVGKNGAVSNMRTRGPYKVLDKEAKRIVSQLPKMKPAMQRDRPVKVSYSIPIYFKYIGQ
jgi:protein TonB